MILATSDYFTWNEIRLTKLNLIADGAKAYLTYNRGTNRSSVTSGGSNMTTTLYEALQLAKHYANRATITKEPVPIQPLLEQAGWEVFPC